MVKGGSCTEIYSDGIILKGLWGFCHSTNLRGNGFNGADSEIKRIIRCYLEAYELVMYLEH